MLIDTALIGFISFLICVMICPVAIPMLHKFKFGQMVRDDGPNSHLKKTGTPTMGGIMILLAVLIASTVGIVRYPMMIPVLLFMLAFGCIGFTDDYLKIKKGKSEGLKARQKLFLQLIITGIFAIYLYQNKEVDTGMLIPFTGSLSGGYIWRLGILFIPAVIFIVLGTDNGVNFTDGLDGLCTCVTIAVTLFFAGVAIKENIPIAPICGAVIGALLGFLVYNRYPAKIFMGDTGSLALGGFVASTALMMRLPLFIIIVGFIYFIEVLSVIIQVGYFKKTKGKRFFKMAPIHHHFELCGWKETKVVFVFTLITIVLVLISYCSMYL